MRVRKQFDVVVERLPLVHTVMESRFYRSTSIGNYHTPLVSKWRDIRFVDVIALIAQSPVCFYDKHPQWSVICDGERSLVPACCNVCSLSRY